MKLENTRQCLSHSYRALESRWSALDAPTRHKVARVAGSIFLTLSGAAILRATPTDSLAGLVLFAPTWGLTGFTLLYTGIALAVFGLQARPTSQATARAEAAKTWKLPYHPSIQERPVSQVQDDILVGRREKTPVPSYVSLRGKHKPASRMPALEEKGQNHRRAAPSTISYSKAAVKDCPTIRMTDLPVDGKAQEQAQNNQPGLLSRFFTYAKDAIWPTGPSTEEVRMLHHQLVHEILHRVVDNADLHLTVNAEGKLALAESAPILSPEQHKERAILLAEHIAYCRERMKCNWYPQVVVWVQKLTDRGYDTAEQHLKAVLEQAVSDLSKSTRL